jgi:hypothetical protein
MLRERLRAALPIERDGSIHLIARAFDGQGFGSNERGKRHA